MYQLYYCLVSEGLSEVIVSPAERGSKRKSRELAETGLGFKRRAPRGSLREGAGRLSRRRYSFAGGSPRVSNHIWRSQTLSGSVVLSDLGAEARFQTATPQDTKCRNLVPKRDLTR